MRFSLGLRGRNVKNKKLKKIKNFFQKRLKFQKSVPITILNSRKTDDFYSNQIIIINLTYG